MDELLQALGLVGDVIGTPGAFMTTALAGENPFPGIFDTSKRKYGRDVLRGALGPDREGIDAGDVAGFGIDVAADPLSWLLPALGAAKYGGKALGAVKSAGRAARGGIGRGLIGAGERLVGKRGLDEGALRGLVEAVEGTGVRPRGMADDWLLDELATRQRPRAPTSRFGGPEISPDPWQDPAHVMSRKAWAGDAGQPQGHFADIQRGGGNLVRNVADDLRGVPIDQLGDTRIRNAIIQNMDEPMPSFGSLSDVALDQGGAVSGAASRAGSQLGAGSFMRLVEEIRGRYPNASPQQIEQMARKLMDPM